ncbi:sensor histidine kinase [Bacillus sp. RAR_GA_16]|uniref:sensor histidine kinase n=1 Tax=Bacillus sp. RAR_GA_16 TaxID=2876774 RepID=UPI001CCECAEB|nr:HAMP domain-containing sensor histidine kinase [Bacillus sp. RAR_GA_16]MCA0172658.1 HAMP domain-containing histidine kinase [Bacillus sp. RAR_GA_16]
MRKIKIGTKLFLSYVSLIVVILLITTVSFRYLFQEYLVREARDQLQKEGLQISQMLEERNWKGKQPPNGLLDRRRIEMAGNLISSQFIIYNKDDKVIYANVDEDVQFEYEENEGKRFVTEEVPINASREQIGRLVLFTKVESLEGFNRIIEQAQALSLFVSAAVAVLLAAWMQRGITGPIRLLADHMKGFSLRKTDPPLKLKSKDEIHELAETFEELTDQLRKNDLDQKEFLQNASHELKTPLMAIQGNAEGILDDVIVGNEVEHSLQVIVNETQRLKKIVQDLSYLTRLETVEESFTYEFVHINRILQEAMTAIKPLAYQNQITLEYGSDPDIQVKVDADKMKQAFLNILGNALRFASSLIEIRMWKEESQVTVEIQDDGTGFGENPDRVFKRFYTGDQSGSGIGLAITKTIVEKHHGEIYAENHKKGGRVVITLPL